MTVAIIGDAAAHPTEPMTNQPSGVIGVPRPTVGGGGILGILGGTVVCPYAGASAPATVTIASNTALASFPIHPLRTAKAFYTAIGRAPCPSGSRTEVENWPNAVLSPPHQSACGTRRGREGRPVIYPDPRGPTRRSRPAKPEAIPLAQCPAIVGPTDRSHCPREGRCQQVRCAAWACLSSAGQRAPRRRP